MDQPKSTEKATFCTTSSTTSSTSSLQPSPTTPIKMPPAHFSYAQTSAQTSNLDAPLPSPSNDRNPFYRPQTSDAKRESGQKALPADFLAEAAKRAEVACMMRDFNDVALG